MAKIGASLGDELRFAVQDIRQSWESAWFGEAVTPANPFDPREPSREDFDRFFGDPARGDAQDINITVEQNNSITMQLDLDR